MKTLTFKVTDDEARRIRALSKRQNLSLSEYLRRRAGGRASEMAPPALVRCEFTGAMIFAPPQDQSPLSTATVREMLADFP